MAGKNTKKPGKPVRMTSRKKIKAARRLAYAYGVQRAQAAKRAQAAATTGWMSAEMASPFGRAWRCEVYRYEQGERVSVVCSHNHKMPETAVACAQQESKRRNLALGIQGRTWTEESVRELVKETVARG